MGKRKNLTRKRRTRSRKHPKKVRCHKGGSNQGDILKKYITNVVYVNLDSRTNRKSQIEGELSIFNPEQVHRVPGIVPEISDEANRNVALARAHLNAVKLARDKQWENTLFLEDDSVWTNNEEALKCFEKLINQPYDAIMLGHNSAQYDKDTLRIIIAHSGASYLLHKSHYDIYIERLEAMINSFVSGVTLPKDVLVDNIVFSPLQKEYKWFAVVPPLMIQKPGHSDRAGFYVDYYK